MSERHLASQLIHTVGFLQGIASRLDALTAGMVSAMSPQYRKAAADCRAQAEHLTKLLQAEGYDRVY